MSQTKVVEKIKKTHIFVQLLLFFRKLYRLCDNVGKCGSAGLATDNDIILRMRIAC